MKIVGNILTKLFAIAISGAGAFVATTFILKHQLALDQCSMKVLGTLNALPGLEKCS